VLSSFADGRLFGERTGEGRPWVLALHGWGRSKGDFHQVLAPTRPGAEEPAPLAAIALDLPGFGASPVPGQAWGSARYATEVAAVLDEMDERVVLLGHSFGGRVAVHLAAARPDKVAGLVLSGVPLYRVGPRRRSPFAYRAIRAAHRAGMLGEERLERARRRYGSADYRAATGVLRDVLVRVVGEEYEAVLKEIACPVELVWGANDTTAPVAAARRAVDVLERAHLVVLEGVGHLTPTEAPSELRAATMRLRP